MASYDEAKGHFDRINSSNEGHKELTKFNHIIEFDLTDDESFYIEIKDGKASVIKGKPPESYENVTILSTDKATVGEIFHKGQLYPGLADFMFQGKVWIKGTKYGGQTVGEKGKPRASWAAKLLRMQP